MKSKIGEEIIYKGDKYKYDSNSKEFRDRYGIEFSACHSITEILNEDVTLIENKSETLTKKEKEYLCNVISPFKKRILHIEKILSGNGEFIQITLKSGVSPFLDEDTINLPFFKINSMYKGLERDKRYSIKDLNLEGVKNENIN